MFCSKCGGKLNYERLTHREQEVTDLLVQGHQNKEIAHILGLTEGTIKEYLNRLYKRIGCRSRYDVFKMFFEGSFKPHVCQVTEATEENQIREA